MEALPRPVDLMFYLGNRSGLRMGEICGLHSPTATKKYYDHFVRETFQRDIA